MTHKQPAKGVVVSAGRLPDLLSLREKILRSAHYDVYTVTQLEEALAVVRSAHCGVLLLCYSVPEEWRGELIREFRKVCPQGRVVGITNYPVTQPSGETDELVYGIEGPEALMDALSRA